MTYVTNRHWLNIHHFVHTLLQYSKNFKTSNIIKTTRSLFEYVKLEMSNTINFITEYFRSKLVFERIFPVSIYFFKVKNANTKMFNNMFNNKETGTMSLMSFWYLYCQLWIYFTHCSSFSCWLWAGRCQLCYVTEETCYLKQDFWNLWGDTVAKQIKNTRVKFINQQVQSFWLSVS